MPSATPILSVKDTTAAPQNLSTDSIYQPARDIRELSPESSKIIAATPIAPSGTRRRPAKNSGVAIEPALDLDEQTILDNCISEVRSLDPRNDSKSIKEFNLPWLLKSCARWPAAADIRVKTYMHEKNIYDPEAPDVKILPLIKSLRKGTEIEVCEPHQSKVFQNRTTDRIFFLAKDMVAKGLITMQENPPQKIPLFREFWINRHSEYGPKETVTKTAATIERPDVFSTEYLPPDRGSNFRTPTAKMVSKGPQKSSTTTTTSAQFAGTRRKYDISNEGAITNEQQQKKRKTSATTTGTQPIITSPIDQSTVLPSVEDALREDPIIAENVEFAREFLSLNKELEAKYPPRKQSAPKDARPMTPTSPVVTSNLFQRTSRPLVGPAGVATVHSFDTSNAVPTSPQQRLVQASPKPQAANPPPALILESADGSFDDENPLPSAHFRDSNVHDFFHLVSEITGKPRGSFNELTFTFMFIVATSNDRTWLIHEGDDVAWNKLQKKARFLCNLWKSRTEESELQLVVEFGDKKNLVRGLW